MQGRRFAVIAGAATIAFLVVATLVVLRQLGITQPFSVSHIDETLERGAALYGEYCASCHGDNLEGQANWQTPLADGGYPAPPHDETGHTWHHPDELLVTYTRDGGQAIAGPEFKSNMPGFGDELSDDEILAVIEFIKSTWPAEIRQRQAQLSQRAEESEK